MGIWQYVSEQLNPELIQDPLSNMRTPALDASRRNPIDVLADYNQERSDARNKTMNFQYMVLRGPRVKSQSQEFFRNLNKQYVTAKLQRAIDSPRQLQEVMTEFWYQHFNVCINKDIDRVWVGPYEDQAIRPYALGRFRDLLGATCHHPAMLYYLDNWQNTAPNSKGAKGNQRGLNENYARELMELHTLGVDGGYTQKDVIELARILTGLGYAPSPAALSDGKLQPIGSYGATFDTTRHDFGDKILLGKHFSGTGESEVEQALDMLARQPATAQHVCYKMAQYFVSDKPSPALVTKMAAVFRASDGDIKKVMTTMVQSPEFWSADNNKYKTPFRYVVSAVRAVGLEPQDYSPLIDMLNQQGQPTYAYLTPDGYKNTKEAWLNADSLLKRINFATALGMGTLKGNSYPPPEYRRLGATIAGSRFSPQTVTTIAAQPEELRSALLLGSPEFMYY
jgi:uncharacterized protein (DUF1800 family)